MGQPEAQEKSKVELKAKATGGDELPWMPPPPPPARSTKIIRKMKENPFVPLGCLATVGALSFGLVQLIRGDAVRSQYAMRMRVIAQGGTIFALIVGTFVTSRASK